MPQENPNATHGQPAADPGQREGHTSLSGRVAKATFGTSDVPKVGRIHAVVATSFVSWEFVVAGGFVLPRSVRVRFWGAVRAGYLP
ncbi:hypothetical protein, partial [Amycolatopsis sp. lyj-84]|uniref:hypothetical protein n=1 Tax=Amycolatopsis sp. lyj-84 TaxID=2789284 RepID=UPI003979CD85